MIRYKIVDKKAENSEKIVNIKQIAEITGFSVGYVRRKIWYGQKINGFDIYQASITYYFQRLSKFTYYDWRTMVKAHSMAELVDLSGRSDKWFKAHWKQLTSKAGFESKSQEMSWRLIERVEWERI